MASIPFREKGLYEFSNFRLDTGERALYCEGQLIPLAPKVFDTLLALVEAEGKVVEKEELLKRIWPDTFVEEGSLAQNISILRKALGEGANERPYIQTLPKRGYRFVAPDTVSSEANGGPPQGLAAPVPFRRHLRKYALAMATALVVVAGLAFVAMRYPRAKPLTDQDVLVLADFTNSTGDPVFDTVLRDALAFQLEQSPFLKVLDDSLMRGDLKLMRRTPQEHITNDLAQEICVREGKKAMLGGAIANLGKSYAIELKATNCQTATTLAREQVEAGDKDHVLQALARAAQGMRAKLGESLSSIQKLAPPNEWATLTTGSLEAFQTFNAGVKQFGPGNAEAIPVFQRVTELDPDFAFGWIWLANSYYNSGDREHYHEYMDRAWALRDRVSVRERLWIVSYREGQTTAQYIANFENWARTFPRDPMPWSFLGRVQEVAGKFEEALPNYRELDRLYGLYYPRDPGGARALISVYRDLDRFEEAHTVAERMFARGVDVPLLRWALLVTSYAQGDQQSAAKQIAWFAGKPDEYVGVAQQAIEARVRGQLRKSHELFHRAADLAQPRKLPDFAAEYAKSDMGGDALVGNCRTSRKPGALPDSMFASAYLRAYRTAEGVLALCGTPALAQRVEELNKRWVSTVDSSPAQVPVTRAAAALGLGSPDKAVDLLQAAAPYERAYPLANYVRGLAYLKLRKGMESAAEFQKILDHRGANWGPLYPLSYVGVARAAAVAGDTARARQAYEEFFELWKDADSDVPILIQARKEYGNLSLAR